MFCYSTSLSTNRAQHEKTPNHLISLVFKNCLRAVRDTLLPPCRVPRRVSGSAVSAKLVLLLTFICSAAHAQRDADGQTDQAIEQHFNRLMATEARKEGWRDARFSHESVILEGGEQPVCTQPLTMEAADGSQSLLGRHRLTLRCNDQDPWVVKVNTRVDVFVSAVFANQLIERGHTITADQLKLQELKLSRATRSFFSNIDDAVGMGAKRRIRPDQLITSRLLTMPLLVRRGQQVDIVARKEGIAATTLGEALEDGQQGDVVRVRNISSEKIIKAQVIDDGRVTSTF